MNKINKQEKRKYLAKEIEECLEFCNENYEDMQVNISQDPFFMKPLFVNYPKSLFEEVEDIVDDCIRSFLPKLDLRISKEEKLASHKTTFSSFGETIQSVSVGAVCSRQKYPPKNSLLPIVTEKRKEFRNIPFVLNESNAPEFYIRLGLKYIDADYIMSQQKMHMWLHGDFVYIIHVNTYHPSRFYYDDIIHYKTRILSIHADEFVHFFPNLHSLSMFQFSPSSSMNTLNLLFTEELCSVYGGPFELYIDNY
jgi:hypothetical protein